MKKRYDQIAEGLASKIEEESNPYKYYDIKMPKDAKGALLWVEEEIYSLWLNCGLNMVGSQGPGNKLERKRKLKHQLDHIKKIKEENEQI